MENDAILDQGFINYISVPSLQSITIVKIVVELWKQSDLREEIQHQRIYEAEKKISKKLDRLPNLLKDKALNIIKPIGMQILKWIDQNQNYPSYNYADSIYWTMYGTINQVKTLELYLSNENLVDCTRIYNTACAYCAEDHIVNLWKLVVSSQKSSKKESSFYCKSIFETYKYHLIAYWTCFAKGELSKLLNMITPNDVSNIYDSSHSVYENMFTLSVSQGNELAVKYFWNKLTHEEISSNIMRWTEDSIKKRGPRILGEYDYRETNEYTDILCFLLSNMNNKEQQREIFEKYGGVILEALFFDWRCQKLILPTIQLMWDFLDRELYVLLLSIFLEEEIKEGRNMKILRELWRRSPIDLRKCFIQHSTENNHVLSVLYSLCKYDDVETITLILNDVTGEEKNLIIFRIMEYSRCDLIYKDKLALLEMVVQDDTLSSKGQIDSFKKRVRIGFGDHLCYSWICNDNWRLVENFLDWGFTSQEEIDQFKKEIVDVYRIFKCLVGQGNYERVDKLMKWYFSSNEEIDNFKKEFIQYEWKKIDIIKNFDWPLFEKFVNWCFNSEEEINKFKVHLASFDTLTSIVHDIMYAQAFNLEFADLLLVWCFTSEEEIKQFKNELLVSDVGLGMFNRFANDKKLVLLTKWFYPIETEVIAEFKTKFKECYHKHKSESRLFCVLDNLMQARPGPVLGELKATGPNIKKKKKKLKN